MLVVLEIKVVSAIDKNSNQIATWLHACNVVVCLQLAINARNSWFL